MDDAPNTPESAPGVQEGLDRLSEALDLSVFSENSIGSYAMFVTGFFLTFVVSKLIQLIFRNYLKRWASGSKTRIDDILILAFERPLYYLSLIHI